MTNWKDMLQQIQAGSVSIEEAEHAIEEYIQSIKDGYVAMPDAHVDIAREKRTGFPEVIFGEGKTAEQIIRIIQKLNKHTSTLLATRIDAEKANQVIKALPEINLTYDSQAKIIFRFDNTSKHTKGYVAVLCAGTSDLPIAEEASLVAEAMGSRVERLYDVGVSGLHRLLSRLETVRQATAIVVVAGMEGALASVVGGLVQKPVIAVPTSVGYGSSFQGLSALLTMLNSCAPGVTVVNIDNGFGAGYQAGLIHKNQQGEHNG